MLKFLKYLSSLLLFILVLVFLYHQYSLNKEKKLLTSSIGQRVEVDGKQMNVYVAGNGPKTLISFSRVVGQVHLFLISNPFIPNL